MKHRPTIRFAMATLLGTFALPNLPEASAQNAGTVGSASTTNSNILTKTPTPVPIDTELRRESERLGTPITGGTIKDRGAMDPNMRINGGPSVGMGYPGGMDSAMLVEHALGMAIEGTSLKAMAEQSMATSGGHSTSINRLLAVANKQLEASKMLMTRAANDGKSIPLNSPARRFYTAASLYLANLDGLGPLKPDDRARATLINHAVKDVLDADHIAQMGRSAGGSLPLEQLMNHASMMKNEQTEFIAREAGNGTLDPNAPVTVDTLARRGREVIEAASQLASSYAIPGQVRPLGIGNPGIGSNPGRLDPERPAIIGGFQGTGSAATGTYPPPVPSTPITPPIPGGTTKGDAVNGIPPR